MKIDKVALKIAVLTVSDTRDHTNDTSGDYLVEELIACGHELSQRQIVKDDIYSLRSIVSQWIDSESVEVVLITGGTGFSSRDSTPEAMLPLFDKKIEGFGELFRQLSYQEIGSSTVQSRALAGVANRTVIFCVPGSTGACKTAWQGIIREQLDSTHKPCNFVGALKLGI